MDLLRIYLQDHSAACAGMVELAKRAIGPNRGTEFERPLAELRNELIADREVLIDAMRRMDVGPDRIKEGAAWGAEKVGRLKLNGRVRGYSPLSRVVELEGLAMLLVGKRRLWETLVSFGDDARLVGVDPVRMAARAGEQLARVEELHTRAAALAFPLAPASTA